MSTVPVTRVLSGIQPTGNLHLGNLLGAILRWVRMQDEAPCLFFLADLHSLSDHIPADTRRAQVRSMGAALIASGIGIAAFFCFMFSWVELLLSRTLTSVNAKPIAATMTRTVSASGLDWGVLAAAGVLTIIPGALVIWFVRNYIAKGFALGRV